MMSDVVIKVENLHKKFCRTLKRSMAYGAIDISKAIVGMSRKSHLIRPGEFWALEDINFELKRGQILGVIGANGAGKSTLLRVLNGIYPPDVGRVEITGQIGGLIALGAGFHPYLSGRENIFLNGTILGMKKAEIKKNLDSIIDFADIGHFIDSPVSTYSSGMGARLGFSVAIHCVPDILLIDEVLSVGDMSFQNKCLRKLAELQRSARAVIFVGHNMDMVENICDSAILLHEHKILAQGSPRDIIGKYTTLSREKEVAADRREIASRFGTENRAEWTTGVIQCLQAGIMDEYGNATKTLKYGQDITVFYEIISKIDLRKPLLGIGFSHPAVYPCNVAYDSNISNKNVRFPGLKAGEKYRITTRFSKPNLIPGNYRLNIMVRDGESLELYHHLDSLADSEFKILAPDGSDIETSGNLQFDNKMILVDSKWDFQKL